MIKLRLSILLVYLFGTTCLQGQSTDKIRCYFNTPANTTLSTSAPATYLTTFFPDTIAAYINRAKYTIDMAMYNYTASAGSNVAKIATAINAAASRGVRVRWLYNGTSATNNTGISLLNAQVNLFPSANLSNYIMHNKFMVIDVLSADSTDAIIQTGSFNFSDAQTSGDVNNIVFVQSKQVALAYYNEFNKMWGGTTAAPNAAAATFSTGKTASAQTSFIVDGKAIEVYFCPKDNVASRLTGSIQSAQKDLFFGVFTFTDNNIANAIKNKYQNGVRARGIMDENSLIYNAYATLNPVMGVDLMINSGSDLYHDKVMLVDATDPNSDPQVFTGSYNWTNQGQNSNDENAMVIHDAKTANQYYQVLCANFTSLGGAACMGMPCPGNTNTIVSNLKSTGSYQWQVNTGAGFSNIVNSSIYSGATSAYLTLSNAPTTWYGYQYRCMINNSSYSDTTTLKFTCYWNGQVSNNWHLAANWNCNVLPDAHTDVIINNGVKFFPQINQNTSCRSVTLNKGAQAQLTASVQLLLTGQ